MLISTAIIRISGISHALGGIKTHCEFLISNKYVSKKKLRTSLNDINTQLELLDTLVKDLRNEINYAPSDKELKS